MLESSPPDNIQHNSSSVSTDKHIFVTGYSNLSWKDAIVKTINETSQTIKNLNSVEILNQRAIISGDAHRSVRLHCLCICISWHRRDFIKP